MRALAVLTVIAAHAAIPGFGGGFVGVDVFFVISGYLITRLILGSIEREGRFRLSTFYARRARRIVPAATVVLLATVVVSVLYLNFLDAIDATHDALWAVFFAANVRFATQGVDYFALEESPSPLQHYWSLAVEEQFYVVWPVLVALTIAITAWVRRRRAASAERSEEGPDGGGTSAPEAGASTRPGPPIAVLAGLAVVLTAASLAWSVHRTEVEPTAAYFSTLTRAWELGAGVSLALLMHHRGGVRRRWLTEPLGVLGIAGIVVAVVAYDTSMAFPGWEALLPVLSTVALIIAGSPTDVPTDAPLVAPLVTPGASGTAVTAADVVAATPAEVPGAPASAAVRPPLVSRLLAQRPLVVIGDWSYSLYLWHWPVIVLPQVHLGRGLSWTETLIAVALVLEFGYLTHRFVEQPFRRKEFWRRDRRGLVLYPASLVLVLPAAIAGLGWADYVGGERGDDPAVSATDYGLPGDRIEALVRASVEAAEDGRAVPSDLTPDLLDLGDDLADVGECNYQLSPRPLCRRGDVGSDKVIVVTGDSHARAWIPALETVAKEAGYATYYLVKQQCTAAFVDPGEVFTGERWPECEEFHDWVVEQVEDIQPDVVIVATSPPPKGVYTDDGTFVEDFDGVQAELAVGFDDMFAAYRALADHVILLTDVPRIPDEPGPCLADADDLGDCVFPPTPYNESMRQLSVDAAERADVPDIDPTPWLCADELCPIVIGSTIAYRDRSHISATRAAELWQPLGFELGFLTRDGEGRETPRWIEEERLARDRSAGSDEPPADAAG